MTAKKLFSDASIYFFGQMLNRGIGFFLLPLYTRYLTTSDYGILAIAGTLSLIFGMLAGLSLDAAIIVLYFKLSEEDFKSLLFNIWLFLLLIPLIFIGILYIFGASIALQVFPEIPWHPYLSLAVWAAYLGIFPSLLMGLLRAKQQPIRYTIVNIVMFLLQTLLILYFVVALGEGAEGSLKGQVIAAGLMAFASHIIILILSRPWRLFAVKRQVVTTSVLLAVGYIPHIFSIWMLNTSDRWVLGYYVPASEIGIYSLAYTIGMLVHLVGISSISAFSPIYFKNFENAIFRLTLKRLLAGYVTLQTITVLAVSLFAGELLRIMTHPDFHQAVFYVPFIAVSYWFYAAFYQPSLTVIENQKRTGLTLLITLPAAIFNLILNIIFVPRYGILAASVSTLLAFALMAILAVIVSKRLDKMPFPWLKIAPTIAIGLITFWFGEEFLTFPSIMLSILTKSILLFLAISIMFTIAGFGISDAKRILYPA